jgi:hypothetical protein
MDINQIDYKTLGDSAEKLKKDKTLIMEIIKKDPLALRQMFGFRKLISSGNLAIFREFYEIITEALKRNGSLIDIAPTSIFFYGEWIVEAFKNNPSYVAGYIGRLTDYPLEYYSEELLLRVFNDEEFWNSLDDKEVAAVFNNLPEIILFKYLYRFSEDYLKANSMGPLFMDLPLFFQKAIKGNPRLITRLITIEDNNILEGKDARDLLIDSVYSTIQLSNEVVDDICYCLLSTVFNSIEISDVINYIEEALNMGAQLKYKTWRKLSDELIKIGEFDKLSRMICSITDVALLKQVKDYIERKKKKEEDKSQTNQRKN